MAWHNAIDAKVFKALVQDGKNADEVAYILGCNTKTVYRYCRKTGIYGAGIHQRHYVERKPTPPPPETVIIPLPPTPLSTPPSPAMAALAVFDSVIRRAYLQRLREAGQKEGEV